MGRSRGWCFTVNNPTFDDFVDMTDIYESDSNCKYMILGFETAPRTGTFHFQGYVYFEEAITDKTAAELFSPHYHTRQKAGKNVKAYAYCMEGGKYYEVGERPKQGHRTDLAVMLMDLKKKPLDQVINEYPTQYMYHFRGIEKYIKAIADFDTRLVVYTSSTVRLVYKYKTHNSFVVDNEYAQSPMQVVHLLYSRKYDIVFIPNAYQYEREEELADKMENILAFNIDANSQVPTQSNEEAYNWPEKLSDKPCPWTYSEDE